MCTTGAKLLNGGWYLAKTRDPVSWMRQDDEIKLFGTQDDKYRKLIVQNPDPHQDGYYGGMNDQGVAFVATYVGVAENQVSYIRRPYVRLILEGSSAKEAVQIIKSFNPRIGGNMFIADPKECYGLEGVPETCYVEKMKLQAVKTNHFLHLPYENLSIKSNKGYKEWTFTRCKRAQELLDSVNNTKDLKALLRDTKNKENNIPICATSSERECFTHSAFIFDTKNKKAHYAQGNPLTVPFKEYGFK